MAPKVHPGRSASEAWQTWDVSRRRAIPSPPSPTANPSAKEASAVMKMLVVAGWFATVCLLLFAMMGAVVFFVLTHGG